MESIDRLTWLRPRSSISALMRPFVSRPLHRIRSKSNIRQLFLHLKRLATTTWQSKLLWSKKDFSLTGRVLRTFLKLFEHFNRLPLALAERKEPWMKRYYIKLANHWHGLLKIGRRSVGFDKKLCNRMPAPACYP